MHYNVHNYLSRSNMSLFNEQHLKTNVRELFTKFIEDPTTVQGEQGHFLNFLQWLYTIGSRHRIKQLSAHA